MYSVCKYYLPLPHILQFNFIMSVIIYIHMNTGIRLKYQCDIPDYEVMCTCLQALEISNVQVKRSQVYYVV